MVKTLAQILFSADFENLAVFHLKKTTEHITTNNTEIIVI